MKRNMTVLSVAQTAAFLCAVSSARADQAADAFNAWSTAFLVQSNGQTYYSGNPVMEAPLSNPGGWTTALDIELAEDVYQRNHTDAHRKLINDLVTTFLTDSGSTASAWCLATYAPNGGGWKDGWNDDLGWMITAVLHAYQITGNADFLTVAKGTWDCAYSRGWDVKYSGGGVWELMDTAGTPKFDQPSKCALDNDPLMINGLILYQLTGEATYLTDVEGIYGWVHGHLFDPMTGEVHGCWGFTSASDTTGYLQGNGDDNAYNDGTFVQAAEALYRMTGKDAYYQDALLAVNHRVTTNAILHTGDEGGGSEWAYPFVKAVGQFTTYNGSWQKYETWMQNNANAAWNKRNALNITWNDWTNATPTPASSQNASSNNITPMDTRGAAGIWQFFPQPLDPTLVGAFELKNVSSSLSLTTSTGGDGGIAVVQEPFGNAPGSLWTFVPTNGGYYRIQNVGSGLLLTVESNSAQPGAVIVASPVSMPAQGNEQWLPVVNGAGSYTFFNLSSILALDDPGGSPAAGTQFGQWFGNGTTGQEFQLIPYSPALPSDAGAVDAEGSGDAAGAGASPPGANGPDGGGLSPAQDASIAERAGDTASTASSSGCSCRTSSESASSGVLGAFSTLFALGAAAARRRRPRS
jgi:MYXO-CTERM domain-containing protein